MEILNTFIEFYDQEKNKRPLKVSQLEINGNGIKEHTSLKAEQIGRALHELLIYAFYHPEFNHKEDLLKNFRPLKSRSWKMAQNCERMIFDEQCDEYSAFDRNFIVTGGLSVSCSSCISNVQLNEPDAAGNAGSEDFA